jgi:hypothetical protein
VEDSLAKGFLRIEHPLNAPKLIKAPQRASLKVLELSFMSGISKRLKGYAPILIDFWLLVAQYMTNVSQAGHVASANRCSRVAEVFFITN